MDLEPALNVYTYPFNLITSKVDLTYLTYYSTTHNVLCLMTNGGYEPVTLSSLVRPLADWPHKYTQTAEPLVHKVPSFHWYLSLFYNKPARGGFIITHTSIICRFLQDFCGAIVSRIPRKFRAILMQISCELAEYFIF